MRRPDRSPRLLAAALAAATGLAATGAAAGPDDVRRQLDRVEASIGANRSAVQARSARIAGIGQEVRALSEQLVATARRTRALEQAASDAEGRLHDLNAQAFTQRELLHGRRHDMSLTLTALVRLSRQPGVAMLLRTDRAIDAVRGGRLLTVALPHLRQEAAAIETQLHRLESLRQDILDQTARLDVATASLSREQAETERLLALRREKRALLEQENAEDMKQAAALAAEADDLRGLLQRLELDAARQRLRTQERQAPAAERPTRPPVPLPPLGKDGRGEPTRITELLPAGTILEARGMMTMPASGRIVRRFGESRKYGPRTRGITLQTRARAQVVTPHDGLVAFAGPFRNYGTILIIKHGEGYHTLLAGLSRTYVVVGQALLAGEPVGQMGSGNNRSLYVELRRKGEAINPRPWWANAGGRVSG